MQAFIILIRITKTVSRTQKYFLWSICEVIKYYAVCYCCQFTTFNSVHNLFNKLFRFLFEHEIRIQYGEYSMIYLKSSICPFSHLLYLLPLYNNFMLSYFSRVLQLASMGQTRKPRLVFCDIDNYLKDTKKRLLYMQYYYKLIERIYYVFYGR